MLQVLGLTPMQQAVYESLVADGPGTLADLAGRGEGMPWRGRVAESAVRLEELGLLTRTAGPPTRWAALDPGVALDALLSGHRRALHETRQRVTRLAARFYEHTAGSDPRSPVEVVDGGPAVAAAFHELLCDARREVRGFVAPPYLAGDMELRNPLEVDLLARGIRFRIVYDPQALRTSGRLTGLVQSVAAGEQVRIAEVPLKLALSDRPLGLVPLSASPAEGGSCLLVRDPVLLRALSALFELYWDRAVPLRFGGGRPVVPDRDALSATERHLLSLLVVGLTDRAIADNVGWHLRTVRRHLRGLMARLGAATRFQAGYQAVRRGWLSSHGDAAETAGAG